MTAAEIYQKIADRNFVSLKVSGVDGLLEITDYHGKIIYSENFNGDLGSAKLEMLNKAAEYSNLGLFANINPFIN